MTHDEIKEKLDAISVELQDFVDDLAGEDTILFAPLLLMSTQKGDSAVTPIATNYIISGKKTPANISSIFGVSHHLQIKTLEVTENMLRQAVEFQRAQLEKNNEQDDSLDNSDTVDSSVGSDSL